jgi:hypothetical protein
MLGCAIRQLGLPRKGLVFEARRQLDAIAISTYGKLARLVHGSLAA